MHNYAWALKHLHKVNVKLFLFTPLRHTGEEAVQLQSFLNSALDGSDQLHTPPTLPKKTTSERRLGWPWSQYGHFGEQRNLLHCQDCGAHCTVTVPTTLSHLP